MSNSISSTTSGVGVAVSVVVPAFNEAERLPSTLNKIVDFLAARPYSYEVIVVDDGSTDATASIVEKIYQQSGTVRLIKNPGNRGKGYAVRNGMLHAAGQYLVFSDSDLSTPIEDIDLLLSPLQKGYDVVIGSRALRPDWIYPRQPLSRQLVGRVFNYCVRGVTFLAIQDTQCGFKGFRRDAAQAIFSRQRLTGFGFDVELAYLARKYGFRLLEVPVHWSNDLATKVHPFRDGPRMFLDLLRIRWNDWSGQYKDTLST
ncbi:MAG: hypothetical protein A3F68_09335 [Acidobacteria bacterium RIFCSPLOWO2_12_FULL_54_10]|nr:MAG: hypothetical protein A3F68_09335 [Acidobacteria bacterium RIFCSPLOWO2_12_FULL_54_10]